MKLKRGADIWAFLREVAKCTGEVLFCTQNGDRLNLKSELTRYVFVSLMHKEDFLYSSEVRLGNEMDRSALARYLTA